MSDEPDIDEQMRNLGRVLAALDDENAAISQDGIDIQETNPDYTDVKITCRVFHGENE